jgi:hypothetical protein
MVAPLAVIEVPPLLDYPNHLGRIFVLQALPHDPAIARFYAGHWAAVPNLAVDLIGPPLVALLPVHVAGRVLIALSVLLPVLGAVAYGRALGSRRWPLGAALVAYNATELHGFLNFSIAIGLALLLAAAWLRWRETKPLLAIGLALAGAPVLFFAHLMGLVFFGFLAAGAEFYAVGFRPRSPSPPSPPSWPDLIRPSAFQPRGDGARALFFGRRVDGRTKSGHDGGDGRGNGVGVSNGNGNGNGAGRAASTVLDAVRRLLILAFVFTIPAALYLSSDLRHLGGDAVFLPLGPKLAGLLTPFVNYWGPLDWLTAAAVAGTVQRWGRMPGPAAVATGLLLAVFVAAPFAWKETFGLDTRFAIMLGFMLFAGVNPRPIPKPVIAALILLFAVRMALLTAAWVDQRQDLADLRAVMAPIQPGQAVYIAEAGLAEAPTRWPHMLSNGTRTDEHLPALVLIERRAWWPFEFDNPTQQPIETLEPYRTLAGRVASLPNRDIAAHADVCGFDYVLLTGADAVPDLPAIRFRKLVQQGHAALYAITKCKEEPS